jgi:hypothetical protein
LMHEVWRLLLAVIYEQYQVCTAGCAKCLCICKGSSTAVPKASVAGVCAVDVLQASSQPGRMHQCLQSPAAPVWPGRECRSFGHLWIPPVTVTCQQQLCLLAETGHTIACCRAAGRGYHTAVWSMMHCCFPLCICSCCSQLVWSQPPVLALKPFSSTDTMLHSHRILVKHVSHYALLLQDAATTAPATANCKVLLQPTRWYSLPSGPTRLKGLDHIHRPFVHGLWLCAS